MKRCVRRGGLLLLIAVFAGGSALACSPSGDELISLRVTPGELAEPGRTLVVTLFENDCVQVRRPVHFRHPGRHLLRLSSEERRAFDAWRHEPALRDFETGAVRAQMSALQQGRAEGGGRELFEVLDADRYVLTLRDGAGSRELRFEALFQYAERYPEVMELRVMAELVDKLQQLADDARLQSAEVSSRIGERLP